MDTTALVSPDIEAGHALITAIREAGLPVAVAAWLYLPVRREWRLFIASPDAQTYGPLSVIKFVEKIREAIGSPLSLSSIGIANTSNHFVNQVPVEETDLRVPPVPFRGTFLGDEEVGDGFIYLVDRKVRPSRTEPKVTASTLKALRSEAA